MRTVIVIAFFLVGYASAQRPGPTIPGPAPGSPPSTPGSAPPPPPPSGPAPPNAGPPPPPTPGSAPQPPPPPASALLTAPPPPPSITSLPPAPQSTTGSPKPSPPASPPPTAGPGPSTVKPVIVPAVSGLAVATSGPLPMVQPTTGAPVAQPAAHEPSPFDISGSHDGHPPPPPPVGDLTPGVMHIGSSQLQPANGPTGVAAQPQIGIIPGSGSPSAPIQGSAISSRPVAGPAAPAPGSPHPHPPHGHAHIGRPHQGKPVQHGKPLSSESDSLDGSTEVLIPLAMLKQIIKGQALKVKYGVKTRLVFEQNGESQSASEGDKISHGSAGSGHHSQGSSHHGHHGNVQHIGIPHAAGNTHHGHPRPQQAEHHLHHGSEHRPGHHVLVTPGPTNGTGPTFSSIIPSSTAAPIQPLSANLSQKRSAMTSEHSIERKKRDSKYKYNRYGGRPGKGSSNRYYNGKYNKKN